MDCQPNCATLSVWTEFMDAPTPVKVRTNFVGGQPVAQTLQFGSMRMGLGQAFSLGETNGASISELQCKKIGER